MKWYSGQNLPKTHAKPTFSESWFHSRYGLTFGERYCSDPLFAPSRIRRPGGCFTTALGRPAWERRTPSPSPTWRFAGTAFSGCVRLRNRLSRRSGAHLPASHRRLRRRRGRHSQAELGDPSVGTGIPAAGRDVIAPLRVHGRGHQFRRASKRGGDDSGQRGAALSLRIPRHHDAISQHDRGRVRGMLRPVDRWLRSQARAGRRCSSAIVR